MYRFECNLVLLIILVLEEVIKMPSTLKMIKPQYIISEKGQKTAVVTDMKDYESLLKFIENLIGFHWAIFGF